MKPDMERRRSGGAGVKGGCADGGIVRLAVRGRIDALRPEEKAKLFDRGRAEDADVARSVAATIADVRARGDDALRDTAKRYDGVPLDRIEVPPSAWADAADRLDPAVRAALEGAAGAIARFHAAQLPSALEVEVQPGVRVGRRADPLQRVGVYAPGGRAAYPSSVLMGVVPAKVAGVEEVVVCSPAGPDGRPPEAVLAACHIAGADRLFAAGGAAAVAALAYGTASVPRVDKVVGPGNAYVTEAKRQLTGRIAIDCPAGPSEVLILADGSADAETIALEMIAQAEHDPDAAALLVTTDARLLERVAAALDRGAAQTPRREIVAESLAARGALLLADSLGDAVTFANRYAPEHLLLLVEQPRALLPRVRAAGTVFLGAHSSVVFGDYTTGANHVLPTAGLARAYSGLSTSDFLRWTTYQEVTAAGAVALGGPTAALADAEGLPGHAAAARSRTREMPGEQGAELPPARERTPVRFRRSYADIQLYDPGRKPTPIDLSDNTGLFGVPPSAARVLSSLPGPAVTRYPSVYAPRLKQALAALHGVAPENVVTGCGSDDIIDSAFRAFLEPGEGVVYPWPTFGMVPLFAHMNAAVPAAIPLGPDYSLDADRLVSAPSAVTYLCRPNNPTGTQFHRVEVARVIDGAAGIVLIDEAYSAYADDDVLDLVLASDRALSLRTLSKAYGLAGLRVGYAVGPAALIAEVEKSRGPYKVSGPAEAAALEVLARDVNWVREGVATTKENRARLTAELGERGIACWPSSANFVLAAVPAGRGGAKGFAAALQSRGVAVRAFPGLPRAGECIRVSVGPWPMMAAFLDAVDGALAAETEGIEE